LQGFPDGWTCLCGAVEAVLAARNITEAIWRTTDFHTLRRLDELELTCRCPNSARYHQMGNAVSVPVVQALAERMARAGGVRG
jgi:site-specific DNA-cytosine methylase